MSVEFDEFLALAVIFAIAAALIGAKILRNNQNPFLIAFLGGLLAFVYGLPIQYYSAGVSFDTLLLGHFLLLTYFTLALVFATVGVRKKSTSPLKQVLSIGASTLGIVCFVWLVVKVWLLAKYGPLVFAFSRALSDVGLVSFSLWETLVTNFANILLLGAFALFVMRNALGQATGMPVSVLIVLTFLLFMLGGESPVGARRLVLALALLWLGTMWIRHTASPLGWLRAHWHQALIAALILIALSTFYQKIRNNLTDESIAADVASVDVGRFLKGFGRFITPSPNSMNEIESAAFLRPGPLDFFLKVVETVAIQGKGSEGEATLTSIRVAVPKVLYPGEKPIENVDEVLFDWLAITPSGPFGSIDYSTSVAAIGMADFSYAGVLLAAVFIGVLFRSYWFGLTALGRWTVPYVALIGASLQLAISQEMSLTALLSTTRDLALFMTLWIPLVVLSRWARRCVILAVSRGPARAPTSAGADRTV